MAFEAYLYVEGVQADSTSAIGLKPPSQVVIPAGAGPIEIKTFGLGIEMPMVENRSATGAATIGRANFEPFDTEKSLDTSTAALMFFCLSGKHINKAVVAVYRATGEDTSAGKSQLYLKITYGGVIITEVGVNSGGADEMPSETLKFDYAEVEYVYYKTNATTGKAEGGIASFKWNRVANSGEKFIS